MSGNTDRIHVLHVDDEPAFADMAASFLERYDERFRVDTATGAEEAIEMLETDRVDCIVSDYDMPVTDGLEFLGVVREDAPNLPFILFTGKGSEEVASEAISAGVTDYLQKERGTGQYEILANRILNAVERTRIERDAEHTRTQLQAISENSADAIITIDSESHIKFVNPAVEELFGYTPDELIGSPLTTIMPDGFVDDHLAAFESYLETGEPTLNWSNVEFPGKRRDGSEVPLSISFSEYEQNDERRFIGIIRDISQRTEMEAELRERQREREETNALLSTLFEALPQGVLVEDDDREILAVNPQFLELFDLDRAPDTLIGADSVALTRKAAEAVTDQHEFTGGIEDAISDREGLDAEEVSLTDGRTLDRTYRPIDLPNGRGHLWIYRDITDRKKRQRTLARNTRAMEEAPVGITISNPDQDDNPLIYANAEFASLTGYAEAEVLGQNCRFLQGPETSPESVAAMRDAIQAGERVSVELVNYRADGSTFWNRVTIAPVRDDDGEITNFVGFQEDVTDRKEREAERARTIEFLESLYHVATDADLSSQEKITRLLEVGPEKLGLPYGHLTRIDREEGGGTQRIIEASGDHELLQPGGTCPLNRSYCRKTIETEGFLEVQNAAQEGWAGDPAYETFELESYIGTKISVEDELYGTIFFASASPRQEPFTDAERTFIRLMSQLVSYELEREQVREQLERRNQRLEEFASVVSHDLRNPLRVADGRVELLREEIESEHLDAIDRAHERIETLIDDLLTLARKGPQTLDRETVNLATIVESCWATVETVEATIKNNVDGTVPADRSRLKQVFENLIRNAIEHGGTGVTVTVDDLEDGFYIEDDGPGIPEEQRDAVFDVGVSGAPQGTGFGLSIVQEVVDAHGWQIEVTDGSAGGARFEITGIKIEDS